MKVLEFSVEIFKALKSLENDHRDVCKNLEKSLKTLMLIWKMQMSFTLLITDAFLQFMIQSI